jgi:hypothetical protein
MYVPYSKQMQVKESVELPCSLTGGGESFHVKKWSIILASESSRLCALYNLQPLKVSPFQCVSEQPPQEPTWTQKLCETWSQIQYSLLMGSVSCTSTAEIRNKTSW